MAAERGDRDRGGSEWVDEEAGPLIRHFAVTRGRTRSTHGEFALVAVIQTTTPEPTIDPLRWGPEHRAILRLCRRARVVADIGADLDLPVSVLRILLGDLLDHGLVTMHEPFRSDERPSRQILREVLDGLEAL